MKKVLYAMAMFSMVAMFAACGGDNKESKDAKEVATPASDAKSLAKKTCECSKLANEGKDATACLAEIEKMAKEHEGKYAKDQAATKEYQEAFMAELEKCSAM